MPPVRDWGAMRTSIRELLIRRTGADIPQWNLRVRKTGIDDPDELRSWLTREGVVGYPRMLLVMERFGYPDYLLASADALLDGQYESTPKLRPIYDAIVRTATSHPGVLVQARKTYVSLVTPKRTFARVKPVSREAVAIALRLDVRPAGRLEASRIHDSMPVQLTFRSRSEIDAVAQRWIARAYAESL